SPRARKRMRVLENLEAVRSVEDFLRVRHGSGAPDGELDAQHRASLRRPPFRIDAVDGKAGARRFDLVEIVIGGPAIRQLFGFQFDSKRPLLSIQELSNLGLIANPLQI